MRKSFALASALTLATPVVALAATPPAGACDGICLISGTLAGAITSASVTETPSTYKLSANYTGVVLIKKQLVTSGTLTIDAVGTTTNGVFAGTGTIHVQDGIGTIDTQVGITATPLLITFSSYIANDLATAFTHSVVGDVVLGAAPLAGVVKGVEVVH